MIVGDVQVETGGRQESGRKGAKEGDKSPEKKGAKEVQVST